MPTTRCSRRSARVDPRDAVHLARHVPRDDDARTQAAGLPAIEPHLWSYRQLLALGAGRSQLWEGEPPSLTLCDWLETCAEQARQLFAVGHRLAQERIGWEFLRGRTEMD